jgi:F0F1-type ATP synthase assembly protein I
LAVLFPACILVGWVIGTLLDRAFGTSFLRIIFLLLGIAAGFIELIREVQKDA